MNGMVICQLVNFQLMLFSAPLNASILKSATRRVGQSTNYDRLILEIWTDGTIYLKIALGSAGKILIEQFRLIAGVKEEMLANC